MDILIAEDNAVSQLVLKRFLEELGYNVISCDNGQEAWEKFQESPTRIVVSDWDMPLMDGLELCQKIRMHSSRAYTYFILLTVNTGAEKYREAMSYGVDDFLPKPLDKTELQIRLEVSKRISSFRDELTSLKMIIPICAYCKSVRRDQAYWQSVEDFLLKNLERDISHGICPSCYENVVLPSINNLPDRRVEGQADADVSLGAGSLGGANEFPTGPNPVGECQCDSDSNSCTPKDASSESPDSN